MNNSEPARKIIDWFSQNRENHFFRQNRTPYKTWISEVALQQTRIKTAAPLIKRFLNQFPHLKSLAESSEQDVLKAWAGLGYYSRAKNLHKGAIFMYKSYQKIPTNYESLIQIPGIGDYTASAISSICFHEMRPVLDGNSRRVIARTFRENMPINNSTFDQLTRERLNTWLHFSNSPGDFNEGIMELGQKVCTPKKPNCLICPIEKNCLGKDIAHQIPARLAKKEKKSIQWDIFVFSKKETIAMQSWEGPFLKGHLGFPVCMSEKDKILWKNTTPPKALQLLGTTKTTITNHSIAIKVWSSKFEPKTKNINWIPRKKIDSLLISSAMRKTWEIVQKKDQPTFL